MKKASLIVMALFVVASVIGVMVIEKNRKSPQDRFLETSQTVKQMDGYVPVKILNNEGNLQYEFLSYEFVDDKDIEKQTKYKAEYFIEGKVPPSDYVVKWTDYDAMARDYPKFDEWRKSDCSKGMTEGEYEEFMRIHEPEYTIDKHVKTKYLFVKCRITYIGGGRKKVPMDDFNLFFMCGNDYRGYGDIDCYFDHPQPALWEDGRTCDFFWYRFDKVGDSLECVLGFRLIGDDIDLSQEYIYYVGFQPSVTYDNAQFNPAIDKRCVALNDLPQM